MRASRTLLALSLAWILSGCGGGSGGGPGGGGGGASTTVVGIVKDSAQSDAGVAGALVQIGGAQATTGPDGTFTLVGASVGASVARITPPGGAPQDVGFSPPVARGSNGPFELIINIGQIRGRILAPDGRTPAVGAFVTALVTGDSTTAGADGRFQLDNIPGGVTELTAVLGTATVGTTVNVQNGVVDIGDLVLVDDPNPFPPGLPYSIVGRIALIDGGSPAGLVVRLARNGVEIEQAVTDVNGNYGFYVPVGSYTLRVSKAGYSDATGQVDVTNPAAPVRADLALVRQ